MARAFVIGSAGHQLAAHCGGWSGPCPFLADYDVVIASVPSLTPLVDDVEMWDSLKPKLEQLRSQLRAAMEAKRVRLVVITDKGSGEWDLVNREFVVSHNYLWCPIVLEPEAIEIPAVRYEIKRRSLDDLDAPISYEYFEHVQQWDHAFRRNKVWSLIDWRKMSVSAVDTLATNPLGRLIAFRLHLSPPAAVYKDVLLPVLCLPPTDPVEWGIDVILQCVATVPEPLPVTVDNA